jgi:hypothetical protein
MTSWFTDLQLGYGLLLDIKWVLRFFDSKTTVGKATGAIQTVGVGTS